MMQARCKIQVSGEGPRHAKVMIVGEAPGKDEVLQKRPFVGRAGRFLNKTLASVGIERKACYITNVVKFRPTRVVRIARSHGRGERVKIQDRPPTRAEVAACLKVLKKEISEVKPKIIVLLGNSALKAVLDKGYTITKYHGKPIPNSSLPKFVRARYIIPTYHPAAAMRNRRWRAFFVADMRKAAKM